MGWIVGVFAAFLLLMFCVAAGSKNMDQPKKIEYVYSDCTFIPEDKKDVVAKLMVECVNNATAKNTGENQDADDWVKACKEQISQIYTVEGHRLAVNGTSWEDSFHYASACHDFNDSLIPGK